jgi:hypothetical protein
MARAMAPARPGAGTGATGDLGPGATQGYVPGSRKPL